MKKKFLSGFLAVMMMVGLLSACGSTSSAGSEAAAGSSGAASAEATSYVWKCALNSTEGDGAYDMAVLFKEKVSALTDGKVQVDLYGGAQLGSASEVLEGMSAGVANLTVDALGMMASFTNLGNIDAMPYLYSGYDHFMTVWTSDLGAELKETVGSAAGFKLMGGSYRGPRIVTATRKMETWDEFKGFKLRAPNLDVYLKTWQWIGAAPTPLAMNEVYTALQQGTVEGQENPMADSLNYSFDEVCNYWIKTNHVYSSNLIIMDQSYFSSLPADIQSAVEEAADYAAAEISKTQVQKDLNAEQTLKDEGCEVIEVDTADFAARFDGFAEQNFPDLVDWVSRIKDMDPAK